MFNFWQGYEMHGVQYRTVHNKAQYTVHSIPVPDWKRRPVF